MSALKWGLIIVGVLLLLAGIVFALQGDGIIMGSSLMSGNSTYIYVGAVVAIIGLILVAVGAMRSGGMKPKTAQPMAAPASTS